MPIRPAIIAIALLLPGAAQAQMISPMLYNGPQISLQAHANQSRQTPDAPEAKQAPAVDPAALRYKPDLARRKANLAQFVAKTKAADPAGAEQLAQLFASTDVIESIKTAIAPHGLRIDDLSDAYSTYWIAAWQATRGSNARWSPR